MNIKRSFYFLFFAIVSATKAFAQPSNDNCDTPIDVNYLVNDCSTIGAFTSEGATASSYGAGSCFNGVQRDVWFRFTAVAPDVTIYIRGLMSVDSGGTLSNPEVALYKDNNCVGTIQQVQCETGGLSSNFVGLHKVGLTPGASYFIRVQGRYGNAGTFKMCINNYNSPAEPGADCITSAVLCDKSSFVVQNTGEIGNEMEGEGSCLSIVGPAETNPSWFTWTCDVAGTLVFTLTPMSAVSDLDFAVYELPYGVEDCSDKTLLRCCASGDLTFPSPCLGPTGLSELSIDDTEPSGCDNPSQDNFVSAIDMVSGVSYGLLVNNFSGASSYLVDFGGSGTFLGPEPVVATIGGQDSFCINETVTFMNTSTFPDGAIISSVWNFGNDATPQTAIGVGPHDVSYSSVGQRQITLTMTTDLGCKVTTSDFITVLGSLELDAFIVSPTCNAGQDGSITLTPTFGVAPFSYNWGNGFISSSTLSNIGIGNYAVTVQDANGCSTVQSIQVDELQFDLNATSISSPTGVGLTNGSITVVLSNGSAPYLYDFGNGFSSNNVLDNIGIGSYSVTVTDANGCSGTALFEVIDQPVSAPLPPSIIKQQEVIVQPNFTEDVFEVLVTDSFIGLLQFEIYDGTGRQVFAQKVGRGSNIVDASNLPSGLYFWLAQNTMGRIIQSGKVVKL